MQILFLGSVTGNAGPSNANRGFVENWPEVDTVYVVDGRNKFEKLCHLLAGAFRVDIVLSNLGASKLNQLVRSIARMRGLKTVGFCHGYIPYENDVNALGLSAVEIKGYKASLDDCDFVATNSLLQMEFLAEHQPSLRGKLGYANLGIDPFDWEGEAHPEAGVLSIAVTGGTRPIKANEVVAKAVKLLNESGVAAKLLIYGRRYSPNAELDGLVAAGYAQYMEQVSPDEFLRGLRSCNMLVMNSRHEPFGLSALDAIHAGTSLLVSRNCGVAEVLGLEPGDYIEDCENAVEVAEKIAALAKKPNAERIYRRLDFEKVGWRSSALALRNICARVAGVETIG